MFEMNVRDVVWACGGCVFYVLYNLHDHGGCEWGGSVRVGAESVQPSKYRSVLSSLVQAAYGCVIFVECVSLLLGRKRPVMSVSEGFVSVRFVGVVFVEVPDQPPKFFGVGRHVGVV